MSVLKRYSSDSLDSQYKENCEDFVSSWNRALWMTFPPKMSNLISPSGRRCQVAFAKIQGVLQLHLLITKRDLYLATVVATDAFSYGLEVVISCRF
ncbi:unnamed protein product [Cercopithifilaria johnstoni]|uniref:Uncharacterized protein n=1 Tax=Cercopithifilaria johnstoni TaxID=2874296 RepID=A0A8J2Q9P6_9BILA|nr:unnamed protein product [Cercopithifilaria johnstoni]